MEAVFVGAGGHVGGAAQGFVSVNRQIFHAHSAQAAGMGAKGGKNLLRFRRAEGRGAERAGQFGFVQLMIAAQQNQSGLVFDDINQGLDLAHGRNTEGRCARASMVTTPGVANFSGPAAAGGTGCGLAGAAGGFFDVRRVSGRRRNRRFRSRRFRPGP